ncbi:MAG: pgl1 [Oscillospiraceae bacterium]|jgi:DNA-binding beta-propeller fold protein YncE|nr:pgl1 [Oscillospiraceae bacterium]
MKRKFRISMIASAIVMLMCFMNPLLQTNAATPYKTYTENGYGRIVETQTAYTPLKTMTKIGNLALSGASDLKITDDGRIYIADTGNHRILVGDKNGELIATYGEDVLGQPTGIFVAQDKTLYVADKAKKKVFVFNASGEVQNEYTKPNHPLYGEGNDFKPTKLTVDHSGNMYIVCEGNTNGIVHIAPTEGGTFLGYFGTNYTWVSPVDLLRRIILTDEQRARMAANIPSTPTNLCIDSKGLVYTVTQGEKTTSLKKLTIAGKNIIEPDAWDELPAAVSTGNYENIFVLSENGYIYEYNKEGSLLFVFGGRDDDRHRIGLFKKASAIDVDQNDNIYVLDSEKNEIQVYQPTEFTDLVHKALYLYQSGKYTESKEPLSQVIEMNSLFDYANLAMGQAYLQEGNYPQALKYFRLAKDKDGYSDAFWEVRNIWLKRNLVSVILIIIFAVVAWKILKAVDRKTGILAPAANLKRSVSSNKLVSQISYMFYFMRHPIDGCYGIKREKRVSYLSANILLLAFMVLYLINKYAIGFIFKTVQEGRYEFFSDVAYVVGLFVMLSTCTYLVCTITDGEGSYKQIYCSFAYSLAPFIALKPFIVLLSNAVTYNESFLVQFSDFLTYAWIVILVFLSIKEINNYSVKETIRTICLTLFTVLIALLLIFIIYVLVSQVIDFIQAIAGEVVYRIESI